MRPTIYKAIFVFIFLVTTAASSFSQAVPTEKFAEMIAKGENAAAVKGLKSYLKKNKTDALGWYYLGIANINLLNGRDAIKALNEANKIDKSNTDYRATLAYAYLLTNNKKAISAANESLVLDPKNVDALYVLSVVNLRSNEYDQAYKLAKEVIALNETYLNAHLVAAQSLVSIFSHSYKDIGSAKSSRTETLVEASKWLEKYLASSKDTAYADFYKQQLESLIFFANYYKAQDAQIMEDENLTSTNMDGITAFKIISRPRAPYTTNALDNEVEGTIRIAIELGSDKRIKHVLLLRSKGFGLDQSAVAAARQIVFEPAQKDGNPVSSVAIVEYVFTIHQ